MAWSAGPEERNRTKDSPRFATELPARELGLRGARLGLDTVELVMEIEKEFTLHIPDAVASELAVLGDISDYLVGRLRERHGAVDPQEVWNRLHRVCVDFFGIDPKLVTRSAHVVYDLGLD